MFDFIYSNKRNILKNPEKFIIFVKKLLPKYANSLPDSAAISIFREIKKLKGANNLILETGTGASTVVLFVASSVSGEKVETIAKAILPFLAMEAIVIFLITYFPAISMTIPLLTGFAK